MIDEVVFALFDVDDKREIIYVVQVPDSPQIRSRNAITVLRVDRLSCSYDRAVWNCICSDSGA